MQGLRKIPIKRGSRKNDEQEITMLLLCEFELFKEDDMYVAIPFGFPGVTQGYDLQEASEMAYDLLKEAGEHMLVCGEEVPKPPLGNEPQRGGRILLVGADISMDNVEQVSASEAARMLGVSRPRVSHMLKTKKLIGWRDGRDTYVTLDSVRARLADRPKAGRPKKTGPEQPAANLAASEGESAEQQAKAPLLA